MIIVHHLNNSRSQRVLWLLEELGVPYEIKPYQRNAETMLAPPELRAVHPLGKSPVISDGGLTIAESGAIVEYLAEKYGGRNSSPSLAPAIGTPERLRYTYWMHFAEGSAMPPLLMKLIFDRLECGPMPFFVRPVARAIAGKAKSGFVMPNINRILDFMEGELGKSAWFAGARIQRRGHPDELSARGGLRARRAGREAAEAVGVPEEHPRAPRVPARARKRRQVRVAAQ